LRLPRAGAVPVLVVEHAPSALANIKHIPFEKREAKKKNRIQKRNENKISRGIKPSQALPYS
jgi:hypothetical protein